MMLQGDKVGLVRARTAVVAFTSKLNLYDHSLCHGEFYPFTCLSHHSDTTNDELLMYSAHLKSLKKDMETRFADLIAMAILDWFLDPFKVSPKIMPCSLQEEIVELQNDTTAKTQFKNYGDARFGLSIITKHTILAYAKPPNFLCCHFQQLI